MPGLSFFTPKKSRRTDKGAFFIYLIIAITVLVSVLLSGGSVAIFGTNHLIQIRHVIIQSSDLETIGH